MSAVLNRAGCCLEQRLLDVQPLDAPAIAPLGLATLGVPRALPDHLALAAAFASVAGLLGLAGRGVPSGMPASAAAGASVPPWLSALGQVLLGVVIGLLALVALAALIYVGAALLAAVGIGAGLSFFAALIIAGVVLAVGFVILEIRARWEEYAAQHGDPDFWTALQIVGVSLLSLTGIPQLIEARRGARLVSDAPLTETERWVLGLGGLVQVVVFLRGVRAGLRSLGRRGAPRVVDPDGPGSGAPRPAARGAAGGGPGNGGAPRVADPDGPGALRPAASGSTGGGPGNGDLARPTDPDGPGAGAPRPVDADRPGAEAPTGQRSAPSEEAR